MPVRPLLTTFAYYVAFIGLGLEVAAIGPTLTALAAQTQVSLTTISYVFPAGAIGYLIGSLVGGRLYDRWPGHPVMAIMLAGIVVCMALVPLAIWLPLLLAVLFALGFVGGATDVGGNALLVWVHRKDLGIYMNGLHFAFGVGALISPLVVAQVIERTGGVAWAYWLLALLILPMVFWMMRLPSPRPLVDAHNKSAEPVRWIVAVLVAFFLFCVVGSEVVFAGWIHTYALTLDFTPETAAYLNSAFFGTFTLGRLVIIPIANQVRPRTILLVDLIGALVSALLPILWPTSALILWIGVCGVGFFTAPLFATTLTWAERRITMTGQVTSVFFMGSSTSSIIFPWFVGQLFEAVSPRITVYAELFTILAAFVVFAFLMLYGGPPRQETALTR